MIAIIITLLALLGFAVFTAFQWYSRFEKADKKRKQHRKTIELQREANYAPKPSYRVLRCYNPLKPYLDATICVMRLVEIEGKLFQSVIKEFTDGDEDFNILEANELVEHLNSK